MATRSAARKFVGTWEKGEGADAPSAKKRSRGRLELADGQKPGFYKKIKRVVK